MGFLRNPFVWSDKGIDFCWNNHKMSILMTLIRTHREYKRLKVRLDELVGMCPVGFNCATIAPCTDIVELQEKIRILRSKIRNYELQRKSRNS